MADYTRNDGNDEHDDDNQDVDYEGSDDDDDDGDEDGEDGESDNADLSINKVLTASAILPSPVSVQLIQIFKYRSQLDCLEKVMRLELVAMQWIGAFFKELNLLKERFLNPCLQRWKKRLAWLAR